MWEFSTLIPALRQWSEMEFFFFFCNKGEGYFVKSKLSWQILSSSFRSRVVIGSSHWHNGWALWKEVVAWEFFLCRITYHETRQGETEPLSEGEEDRADFHLLTRCHTWISTFSQLQNWETAQNLCCDFPKPVPGTQSRVYALACTNINWVHCTDSGALQIQRQKSPLHIALSIGKRIEKRVFSLIKGLVRRNLFHCWRHWKYFEEQNVGNLCTTFFKVILWAERIFSVTPEVFLLRESPYCFK